MGHIVSKYFLHSVSCLFVLPVVSFAVLKLFILITSHLFTSDFRDSDQCKEIEENNIMGKTRDLFRKIRDTKRTFHAKMDTIKDRNGMELTEAKDIKKRWQEYTEELYKKDFHDTDNHDGVITHLESDMLKCEVKWALGSITTNKASGGDGIPVELFQILKD